MRKSLDSVQLVTVQVTRATMTCWSASDMPSSELPQAELCWDRSRGGNGLTAVDELGLTCRSLRLPKLRGSKESIPTVQVDECAGSSLGQRVVRADPYMEWCDDSPPRASCNATLSATPIALVCIRLLLFQPATSALDSKQNDSTTLPLAYMP